MPWSDGPRGSWWARRYCRRGGFLLVVFAVLIFGIGIEAGSDAAKDLQGRSTPGGTLDVQVLCGSFGFDFSPDAPADPCDDPANRARLFDDAGNEIAQSGPGPFGDFEALHVTRATARMHLLVDVQGETWTRDYYVPDGTRVDSTLHVATSSIDESAHDGSKVLGESRTGHLLGGVSALLAVGAMIGGVCAMLMTRVNWALAGPALLAAAAVFAVPATAVGLAALLPAGLQAIFVLVAAPEFRTKASIEGSVLLD